MPFFGFCEVVFEWKRQSSNFTDFFFWLPNKDFYIEFLMWRQMDKSFCMWCTKRTHLPKQMRHYRFSLGCDFILWDTKCFGNKKEKRNSTSSRKSATKLMLISWVVALVFHQNEFHSPWCCWSTQLCCLPDNLLSIIIHYELKCISCTHTHTLTSILFC